MRHARRVWRRLGELAEYWLSLFGLLALVVFDLARRDPLYAGLVPALVILLWLIFRP